MRPLALVLLGLAAASTAQPADSTARTTTIALPEGGGVFYYRAGPPGGVRIRSRRAPRAASAAATAPANASTASRPITDGVTRLDLMLLEESLLRAIDARLAGLRRGSDGTTVVTPGARPVVVLPGSPDAPASGTPPDAPTRPEVTPTDPGAPSVTVVERALLDTGLFRTTRVPFAFGEATLLPAAETTLAVVADVLRRFPDLRVEVGGHTDSVSSEAFNLALSQRRAEAVRDFLVASGVAPARLAAVGYGEGQPVADNGNETGRALNRRVEFIVRR